MLFVVVAVALVVIVAVPCAAVAWRDRRSRTDTVDGWRIRRDATSHAASQHSQAEAWAAVQRNAQRGPLG
jgi:hypothetical protein